MWQKSLGLRDISGLSQLVNKKLNISYLVIYQTSRSFHKLKSFSQCTSIWKVYSALQQQNNFEFWEMPPAAQHDWTVQDYHEEKSPLI